MKFFILFAIIFFSFRVFSEDTYYYEGRYYKIDEYIRFLDDPQYKQFMKEKQEEERAQKANVSHYFQEKDYYDQKQESERRQYVDSLAAQPSDADLLKAEALHEKERLAELQKDDMIRQQFLAERDMEMSKAPNRMIASVFETDEEAPLKRIPLNKRKYVLKAKMPKKK